ncbi:MAG: hypothetical protein ACK6DI_06555 [Betaproteobacteria bacterium]
MAEVQRYEILGRVVEQRSRRPVGNVRLEAWDRDTRFHDMLGISCTDDEGRFSLAFDGETFGDYGGDHHPDVFFKLLRDGRLLQTTFDRPRQNLQPGTTRLELEVPDAAPPKVGKDYVRTAQVLTGLRFWRESDFRGVYNEGRDKSRLLGKVLLSAAGRTLEDFELKPLRPQGARTHDVVGRDPQTARTNLARNGVEVEEVVAYRPGADAATVQSLTAFPLMLKAKDRVRLYTDESGMVRYSAVVRPPAAPADAAAVQSIAADVQDLKAERQQAAQMEAEVAQLKALHEQAAREAATREETIKAQAEELARVKAELAAAQNQAAQKNLQIEKLRSDVTTMQNAHQDFSQRFAPERLVQMEREMKRLAEKLQDRAPVPANPPVQPPVRRRKPA